MPMPYTKHINQPDMTTSFADFVATQDARNDIQLKIREYCLMLCEALEQDFMQESIKRAHFFGADNAEYREKRLADIKSGKDMYKFSIESGRKYHKIVMETESQSKSVHAFVDKKSGEVFKPASYKAPAKIVRYRLLEIASRELCFANADWAGSYLYIR
jgi:hypothetical protein